MTSVTRAKLATILQQPDRGQVLRRLEELAQEPSFYEWVDVWGPALLDRNASFFEPFLQRHLPRAPLQQVTLLLPRIEALERDELFGALYGLTHNQEQWNRDVQRIAQAEMPDEDKLAALKRRSLRRTRWYTLTEENAYVLYTLDPGLFGPFVRAHVHRGWHANQRQYKALRAAARAREDEETTWALFRQLAGEQEWRQALQALYAASPPADQIAGELAKRHPAYSWRYDPAPLLDFIVAYRSAVLPYLEAHLFWIARKDVERFLGAIEGLEDENLYWRLFFQVGNSDLWRAALRDLLDMDLDAVQLYHALQRRTPSEGSGGRWQRWHIDDALALAFYRRDPRLFRPFVEQFLSTHPFHNDGETGLFKAALERQDEAFLNFLCYVYLRFTNLLVMRLNWHWNQHVERDRQLLDRLTDLMVRRFERLYERGPGTYVRHAADVLSRYRAFEVWSLDLVKAQNPAFAYLFERHRQAWLASPAGIRELLESTNIFVQILGLEFLSAGGDDAARRTVENLPVLRALLLGRARRGTKEQVLNVLTAAAQQGRDFAGPILPVLEETMRFRGRRAINDKIMVGYVRLRRQYQPVAVAG